METLGAAVIDCDKLGHASYLVDTDVYKKLIETFGDEIINPIDRSIDRKILGRKVFQKPDERQKLNNIVWPAILDRVQELIEGFNQQGNAITGSITGSINVNC